MARSKPTRDEPSTGLRIIGGTFRGRPLVYSGDPRTRPMKDRVRENLFNLLTTEVIGTHAFDLFAGTGALGLESISRGAKRATLIERHIPTTKVIRENVERLQIKERVEILSWDTFSWAKRLEAGTLPPPPAEASGLPWVVYVSPPWSLFQERPADMLALIGAMQRHSPPGSIVVVEADTEFDLAQLPGVAEAWDIRPYPPAVLAIWRSESETP